MSGLSVGSWKARLPPVSAARRLATVRAATLAFAIFFALPRAGAAQEAASFCLQPPLSGRITFSGLTLRTGAPPPRVDLAVRGLPASTMVGVWWPLPIVEAFPGRASAIRLRPQLIANFTTGPAGGAATIGRVFFQPPVPAERLTLTGVEELTARSVDVGLAVRCLGTTMIATELPRTGEPDGLAVLTLVSVLGLAALGGGFALRGAAAWSEPSSVSPSQRGTGPTARTSTARQISSSLPPVDRSSGR